MNSHNSDNNILQLNSKFPFRARTKQPDVPEQWVGESVFFQLGELEIWQTRWCAHCHTGGREGGRAAVHQRQNRSVCSFPAPSACRAHLGSALPHRPPHALCPALPTLPHPHLEVQSSRKKLKCGEKKKSYLFYHSWFGVLFQTQPFHMFFSSLFSCACVPTLFSSSIQNTQDCVVGWLVSSGVFSPLIKCCWLFCTCYFISFSLSYIATYIIWKGSNSFDFSQWYWEMQYLSQVTCREEERRI